MMDNFEIRKQIAKEAYRIFIKDNKNLTPEIFEKANAFCLGAKFQRKLNENNDSNKILYSW